ncbi:MAG: nitrophenyl compound nitroreductase subunit ArsF family protein, partial [Elusimicrobiaceae bacterium]
RKLEQYTKEAVEQNFSTGAYAGKVVFAALDVDEKANEHFVDDYQLVAKAVILQPEKNGVAGKWENMDQIWLLLGDKEKFKDYVKNGVLKQLEAK